MLLEIELCCSKTGSSWSTSQALPVRGRQMMAATLRAHEWVVRWVSLAMWLNKCSCQLQSYGQCVSKVILMSLKGWFRIWKKRLKPTSTWSVRCIRRRSLHWRKWFRTLRRPCWNQQWDSQTSMSFNKRYCLKWCIVSTDVLSQLMYCLS